MEKLEDLQREYHKIFTSLERQYIYSPSAIQINDKIYPNAGNVFILTGIIGSEKLFDLNFLLGAGEVDVNVDCLLYLQSAIEDWKCWVRKKHGINLSQYDLQNSNDIGEIKNVLLQYNTKTNLIDTIRRIEKIKQDKPNLLIDATILTQTRLKEIYEILTYFGYKKSNIHMIWFVDNLKRIAKDKDFQKYIVNENKNVACAVFDHINNFMFDSLNFSKQNIKKNINGDIWIAFSYPHLVDNKVDFYPCDLYKIKSAKNSISFEFHESLLKKLSEYTNNSYWKFFDKFRIASYISITKGK